MNQDAQWNSAKLVFTKLVQSNKPPWRIVGSKMMDLIQILQALGVHVITIEVGMMSLTIQHKAGRMRIECDYDGIYHIYHLTNEYSLISEHVYETGVFAADAIVNGIK